MGQVAVAGPGGSGVPEFGDEQPGGAQAPPQPPAPGAASPGPPERKAANCSGSTHWGAGLNTATDRRSKPLPRAHPHTSSRTRSNSGTP